MISDIELNDLKVLLNQIAKHDDSAMRKVYTHYHRAVFLYINSLVRDEYIAETLTIQVFGIAFDRVKKFNFSSKFSTWLCGIARNKAFDALSQNGRKPDMVALDEELHTNIASDQLSVLQQLEVSEQIEVLQACISQLTPNARETIHLAYFEGLSEYEITLFLNIKSGTVKSRLFNARQKIANCVSKIFG